MDVLVTGAAGNIGRSVMRLLTSAPDLSVRAYDRVRGDDFPGTEWTVGDILDVDAVTAALDGVEAVVHLAAIPAYEPQLNLDIGRINILGTQSILEAMVRAGTRRFVQASSICATGFIFSTEPLDAPYLPIDEECPTRPDDMYGVSKLACEHIAYAYETRYGIETTSYRIASVWDRESTVSQREVGNMLDARFDDDMVYVDLRWAYVDVRDVAQAFLLGVRHPTGIGVCNLGAGDTPGGDNSIWLEDRFPRSEHDAISDLSQPLFSIDRLSAKTGYKPEHTWVEYPAFVAVWPSYLERRAAFAHA
jgi:nucleoside-diphosphate-sugar epimerase